MAKKTKTFAEKAMGKKDAPQCPKCGQPYAPLLVVSSFKDDESSAYKYERKMGNVCKCNEKEVYA